MSFAKVLIVVLIGSALSGCGVILPDTPENSAPRSTTRAAAPARAVAGSFRVPSGIRLESLSAVEWEETLRLATQDFHGNIAGGEGKLAFDRSDGAELGVIIVLRPTAAYSGPAAMKAELKRQMRRAMQVNGVVIWKAIGGHDVATFTSEGGDNWYWISGKEYVIVVTPEGDDHEKAFVRAIAERTV